MTNEMLLRYIQLIDRRQQIMLNSGIEILPRYGNELNKIDLELAALRKDPAANSGKIDLSKHEAIGYIEKGCLVLPKEELEDWDY